MNKFVIQIIKDNKGFSIVEFTIVALILMVLSTMAIVALSSQSLVERLEVNTEQLSQNLRTIQNYAMIGYKDLSGNVAKNYCIYFSQSGTYIIYRDENGNNVRDISTDIDLETVNLYENISMVNLGGNICGTVPKGTFCYDNDNNAGGSLCNSSTTFTLKIDNSNVSKDVVVNHLTGNVSVPN